MHFPERRGNLFLNLRRGDKIKSGDLLSELLWLCLLSDVIMSCLLQPGGGSAGSHSNSEHQFSALASVENKDMCLPTLESIRRSHTVKKSKSIKMYKEEVKKDYKEDSEQ